MCAVCNTRQYHWCWRRRHTVRTKHSKRLHSASLRPLSHWLDGCRPCATFVYTIFFAFLLVATLENLDECGEYWIEQVYAIDIRWQLYEATRPWQKLNNIILLAIAMRMGGCARVAQMPKKDKNNTSNVSDWNELKRKTKYKYRCDFDENGIGSEQWTLKLYK